MDARTTRLSLVPHPLLVRGESTAAVEPNSS